MFVKQIQTGHILLVVLMIISLLSLFIQSISRNIVLEYQRVRNQILDHQLWCQLEFDIHTFRNSLELNDPTITHRDPIAFVTDTLEMGCKTGIVLHTFTAKIAKQQVLVITYSMRQ